MSPRFAKRARSRCSSSSLRSERGVASTSTSYDARLRAACAVVATAADRNSTATIANTNQARDSRAAGDARHAWRGFTTALRCPCRDCDGSMEHPAKHDLRRLLKISYVRSVRGGTEARYLTTSAL